MTRARTLADLGSQSLATDAELASGLSSKADLASPSFTGTPSLPFGTDLNSYQLGGWNTYTPTWTNFTPGNATIYAWYSIVGKIVNVHIYCEMGSTSVLGTGPRASVPVPISGNQRADVPFGEVLMHEVGVTYRVGKVVAASGGLSCSYISTALRYSNINATSPFTWAASDRLNFFATYQTD